MIQQLFNRRSTFVGFTAVAAIAFGALGNAHAGECPADQRREPDPDTRRKHRVRGKSGAEGRYQQGNCEHRSKERHENLLGLH